MDNAKLTKPTRKEDVQRSWHLVDAKGKVIGRIATDIAHKLIGKGKTSFSRNIDGGDYVVVINAKEIVSTGKKEKTKLYTAYSGFPGGMKAKALWQIRQEKPTEVVRHAVWGMLPKNKLRHRMITRLHIYANDKHPYAEKFVAKNA
jgi:large subunit ribosomal protein L13